MQRCAARAAGWQQCSSLVRADAIGGHRTHGCSNRREQRSRPAEQQLCADGLTAGHGRRGSQQLVVTLPSAQQLHCQSLHRGSLRVGCQQTAGGAGNGAQGRLQCDALAKVCGWQTRADGVDGVHAGVTQCVQARLRCSRPFYA
eukprot:PLAT8986.2.p2 GENE.PLAT8986.2~~PLAT8986.2.p2  ORF type:complete len:144 (+),score=35.25 PLAT8986.2:711-1142(+)